MAGVENGASDGGVSNGRMTVRNGGERWSETGDGQMALGEANIKWVKTIRV